MTVERALRGVERSFLQRHAQVTQAFALYACLPESIAPEWVAEVDRALVRAHPELTRCVRGTPPEYGRAGLPAQITLDRCTGEGWRELVVSDLSNAFLEDATTYRWRIIDNGGTSVLVLTCHAAALDGFSALHMLQAVLSHGQAPQPTERSAARSTSVMTSRGAVGCVALSLRRESTAVLTQRAKLRNVSLHGLVAEAMVHAVQAELGLGAGTEAVVTRIDLRRWAREPARSGFGVMISEVVTPISDLSRCAEHVTERLRAGGARPTVDDELPSAKSGRIVLSSMSEIAALQFGAQPVPELGAMQGPDAGRLLKGSCAIYNGCLRLNLCYHPEVLSSTMVGRVAAHIGASWTGDAPEAPTSDMQRERT